MTPDPQRVRKLATSYRLLFVACSLLLAPSCGSPQQQGVPKPSQLPTPFETIQDKKQFNAVQLGPGNTFSIVETPPDFHLSEFAVSPDGSLLAIGWASGRIELWDLHSKKRVSEFKSDLGAPGVLQFGKTGKQLIVTGSGGKIALLDLPRGKKLRSWTISLGKYKYDVHELVFDPKGRWLAYADEESSRVLDVSVDPPKQIADLKDAYSIALSQDGSELWTVNRSELAGFSTDTWSVIGLWPLKSSPVSTSTPLVLAGVTLDGKRIIAVPSGQGLVFYRSPKMEGDYITDKPTTGVAFAPGRNVFVNFSRDLTFVDGEGRHMCEKSYKGRVNYAVSGDGQWLAISQFNSVDLWRLEDLLRDCNEGR
jgi:WD40 repeat protein